MVATLYKRPYRKAPATPPRFLTSGSGTRRRKAGPKIAASPADNEKIAAPTANAAFQPASRRPRYAAAMPMASRLTTSPKKKASETSSFHRGPLCACTH
jgi:hypothetical protein